MTIQDPQDCQKQVQQVQVQGNHCRNLLFNMEPPHNKLCINQLHNHASVMSMEGAQRREEEGNGLQCTQKTIMLLPH